MIVQISKLIIAKRNIHLKEIEQYLKSLKSNINPELIKISKELINEGRNIITQNTKKKYAEFQRIAQNITKMRDELEQKMQQELKSDKSKLRAEIEGKIVQNEKEFEDFRKSFLAQFKLEKDAKKPEMKKLEVYICIYIYIYIYYLTPLCLSMGSMGCCPIFFVPIIIF